MEMFNIKENLYALLTPEKKIIVWHNCVTPYPQILLHEATKMTPCAYQHNSYTNKFDPLLKVFNKNETAWATITKERNVKTGGKRQHGGDSSSVKSQLKNVKIIVSTYCAFAALLSDGSVVAWGSEPHRGKNADDIQQQLKNVKI